MNQPAPAWPAAPLAAPDAPPAAAPGPMSPAIALAPPMDPEAALDVTAPLQYPQPAALPEHVPMQPSPAPDAPPPAVALEQLTPEPAPAAAAPEGVTRSEPVAHEPAAEAVPPAWCAPGTALVAGMFALTWQLVTLYTVFVLPIRAATGATLDNFDTAVARAPFNDASIGPNLGVVLGLGAIALVFAGGRRGVREPVLQGVTILLGLLAIALLAAIPRIFPVG